MTRIFLTIYVIVFGIIMIPIIINLATDKFRKESEYCFFGGLIIYVLVGIVHVLLRIWG